MATSTMDLKKVDQAVGAAFLASGIASVTLGVLVVLADASAKINTGLVLVKPVGALSGKTTIEVVVFILSWVIAHYAFRTRDIDLAKVFRTSLILVGVGFLLTFPPVFEIFVNILKPMFGS
jgi:hypothetical protein